jgi:hypothetical protein
MKSTSDIWFAAFVVSSGKTLSDYSRKDGRKVNYMFDMSEEDWKELRKKFFVSELSKHRQLMDRLKDLSY